jgi:hypothetical protein
MELTDDFTGRRSDGDGSLVKRSEWRRWCSLTRCFGCEENELRAGSVSARHRRGLGSFYRASEGAERTEGRTTGNFSGLQWCSHFGSKGKRRGGEMGSRGGGKSTAF